LPAIDSALLEYATAAQKVYLNAIAEHGSKGAAAKALGRNQRSLERSIASLYREAVRRGYSPEHDQTHPCPDTQQIKGVSTQYGPDGEILSQWVKTSAKQEQLETVLREFAEGLVDDVKGRAKPVKCPATDSANALTVYPMGDPHIGMFAWNQDAGNDYDLSIATDENRAATDRLARCAPRTRDALIINLGDYFHADNMESRTAKSGHVLDVDTRITKVVRVGVDLMRYKIEAALKIHERVQVRNAVGNHDELLSSMLSLILEAYYSKEPRVKVETSPRAVWYHRFGKCLIGVTHGDRIKLEDLNGVMAVDAAEDWGKTEHRYWYTGHIHHRKMLELRGCVVESFRSLVAKDAYADSHGYRAGRDMCCIVLDKDHGEVERHRIDISMLKAA